MKNYFPLFLFINVCLFVQNNLADKKVDNLTSINPLQVVEDSSFMPLQIDNNYQYIMQGYGGGVVYYYLRNGTITKDTIIQDKKYYYYSYANANHWFRYSEENKKLFKRVNEVDQVYMDFSKEPGDTFIHLDYQNPAVVVSGDTNLFSTNFNYKGFQVTIGPGGTKKELFANGLGIFYTDFEDQGMGSNTEYDLIMATIFDSTGNSQNYTNHYEPEINVTPITLIDSYNFELNFTATHQYNRLVPPGNVSMIFIEYTKFESYYSKEDSVVELPDIINHLYSSEYTINVNLDTILMKDGFTFNYRIVAKDKGIIPEISFSPDSGYYKCGWDFGTGIEDENKLPEEFYLFQNFPNPFNPITKIKFSIPSSLPLGGTEGGLVTLKIYDILGREVANLVKEVKQPGVYEVEFDGSNLSSGIYYYQLKSGNFAETKKLVLMK